MGDYVGERFTVSSGARSFYTTSDALNLFAKIDDFVQSLVFLSHIHCHLEHAPFVVGLVG